LHADGLFHVMTKFVFGNVVAFIDHDHRHPDGSPEDVSLYGGYADSMGTPFTQNFPADPFTCEQYPTSCNATWTVSISPDLTTFSYQLKNFGELLFKADFNLANPL
jgi:hypothetical protein